MSAGEFVELANLIEAAEGAPLPNSYSFALLWPAAMPDDVAKWLTANLPVKVCVNPPRSAVRHVAVPRYDFPPGGWVTDMVEAPDGPWVLFEDVELALRRR